MATTFGRAGFVSFLFLVLGTIAPAALGDDDPKKARTDHYGDPLPLGAVARMGSTRFRHAGLSDFVFRDGSKTILTSGSDRVLRFWDLASGKPTGKVELQGQTGPGRTITLSPDGKLLAAQDSGNILLWEVESGKEIKTLTGPKHGIGFLYFSPDGKTLAVGRGDRQVSMWEWQTGQERSFPLAYVPRNGVEFRMDSSFHGGFSPDGKWFVAKAASTEPLGVFDAATGREIHRLTCYASTSTVSPDSKRLAVSCWTNDKGERESVIRLFDLAKGTETGQFPLGHEESYRSLAFSPDGKLLACGFSDHSCVLDCTTGRVLHHLSGRPIGLEFSPDGKTLVARSGRRLRFWDAGTGKEFHDYPGEFGYTPVLTVSPDGRFLAAGDRREQAISLWEAASGRLVRQLPLKGEKRHVRDLAFTADGQTLVACQGMGFLQVWDVATGKEVRTAQLRDPSHPDKEYVYFYRFHVSPDAKHMATLERIMRPVESTRVALWETTTGKLLHQLTFPGEIDKAAWSTDGKLAALPLADGLMLTDVPSGAIRFQLPGTVANGPVAASPDGRLFAAQQAVSKTGNVSVWESASGKEVAVIAAQRVDHFALAGDDRLLVTTDPQFLHVWDLAHGQEQLRRPLPQKGVDSRGGVFALALSPDSRSAFTALADGTCLVWDLISARPAIRGKAPTQEELTSLWNDLAGKDAAKAYQALWRLADAPDETIRLLRQQVKPTVVEDPQRIRRLIADLDNDAFGVREAAQMALAKLGAVAETILHEALDQDPSAEARRRIEGLLANARAGAPEPETLRHLRAVQVLEQVATPEARQVLQALAGGAAHARLTREAKAALERLNACPAKK
jgi:WD40 repeat protein